LRRSGSPPVTRILCIPRLERTLTALSISAKLSISLCLIQWIFSFSGMQKRQAKLHLSVTETLSFVATLPFQSTSVLLEVDGGSGKGKRKRPPRRNKTFLGVFYLICVWCRTRVGAEWKG